MKIYADANKYENHNNVCFTTVMQPIGGGGIVNVSPADNQKGSSKQENTPKDSEFFKTDMTAL